MLLSISQYYFISYFFKLNLNASSKSLYEVCWQGGEIGKQMNIKLDKNYLKLNLIYVILYLSKN
jgi:hypothetical protein